MNKIYRIINEELDALYEGINVYHGTDAYFTDFDLNKIGSGSGNSLGGWGIYFSADPEVAKQYMSGKGFLKKCELSTYSRFFDFDSYLSDGTGQEILRGLESHFDDSENIAEFQSDFLDYEDDVTNKQAYEWLSYVFDNEKGASLFLKKLGYDGNMFSDRTNPDAKNYVVYNTDIIKNINDDDLLNEDFVGLFNKLKTMASKGMITTAILSSLLASPKLSDAQKVEIRKIVNTEKIVEDEKYLSVKEIKNLVRENKLYGEVGSRDEFKLHELLKNGENKFIVFDADGETTTTSKLNAIAEARENGHTNRNDYMIFFQNKNNKTTKAYIIIKVN